MGKQGGFMLNLKEIKGNDKNINKEVI